MQFVYQECLSLDAGICFQFFEALDQRPNSLNINANVIHFFTRIIYGHGGKEFQKDTFILTLTLMTDCYSRLSRLSIFALFIYLLFVFGCRLVSPIHFQSIFTTILTLLSRRFRFFGIVFYLSCSYPSVVLRLPLQREARLARLAIVLLCSGGPPFTIHHSPFTNP